jgi:hypothetical protein
MDRLYMLKEAKRSQKYKEAVEDVNKLISG